MSTCRTNFIMNMKRIIVLEGINGSGKTTQILALKKHLEQFLNVLVVSDKNTRIMQSIADISSFNQMTQALIYLSCCSENINKISSSNADIVLYDRYFLSTLVYQNDVSSYVLSTVNGKIENFNNVYPNVTIFLHLTGL